MIVTNYHEACAFNDTKQIKLFAFVNFVIVRLNLFPVISLTIFCLLLNQDQTHFRGNTSLLKMLKCALLRDLILILLKLMQNFDFLAKSFYSFPPFYGKESVLFPNVEDLKSRFSIC